MAIYYSDKLDSYRAVLDDGLCIENDNEVWFRMRFIGGKYRVIFENIYTDTQETEKYRIDEEDWGTFKKKFRDYYSKEIK